MGSEPQPPVILVHFRSKRKVLTPLKSTISFCGGVARKLSLVKIPILNTITPLQFEDCCKVLKNMVWGGAPAASDIMVYF